MREILFRGKRTDNGEWVVGFLYASDDIHRFGTCSIYSNCWIIKQTDLIVNEYGEGNELSVWNEFVQVIPETVGQYTGLKDKNGKRIFEGDIVRYKDYAFVVKYGKCGGVANCDHYGYMGFYYAPYSRHTEEGADYGLRDDMCYFTGSEVIGNIHDHSGLLKEEQYD